MYRHSIGNGLMLLPLCIHHWCFHHFPSGGEAIPCASWAALGHWFWNVIFHCFGFGVYYLFATNQSCLIYVGLPWTGYLPSFFKPRGNKPSFSAKLTWQNLLSGAPNLSSTLRSRFDQTNFVVSKICLEQLLHILCGFINSMYNSVWISVGKPVSFTFGRQFVIVVPDPPKASLDYKHINDRFQRGRAAVDGFMSQKHQFLRVNSLVLAHSGIVEAQGNLGPDGFPSSVLSCFYQPSTLLVL